MLSVLGTIHCQASSPTLNAILLQFGLKAIAKDGYQFDVTSLTKHSDPALERDLYGLALQKLAAACADGALPKWRQISYVPGDR